MAYTNKVPVAAMVATTVLFLAVTMAPQWTEAQPEPNFDPVCLSVIPDIVEICYTKFNLVPSEECCKTLKSASNSQVTCVCDHFIAHPSTTNLTRSHYDEINTACGAIDKFACKGGGTNGGGSNNGGGTNGGSTNGGITKGGTNGGATNKIAATMSLFGLVASLFF
ncbi:unnamed protein product [Arabis nemorensis]|uniref:Bifunctional inhibitor/plant lipid transfer protein/seed storage helical domain-containing protein n=1 Tax=Arabis nemorensis TaxID=586526 RepID=A0A565CEK3_9BRAS|nr:unnamed protein product [Arabis nemorensis]